MPPLSPHAASRRYATVGAAERWFLNRGLPSVLTTGARLRAVWPRSAPGLAGVAVVETCLLTIYFVIGKTYIHIEAPFRGVDWVVLAILGVALPAAGVAGWLVARLVTDRSRVVVSAVSVAVALACGIVVGGGEPLTITVATVLLVLYLTATGIGSMLGWAVRLTFSQLAAIGGLVVRALPVVLLTVLVFFNTYAWIMSSIISETRLSVALAFLVAVAAVFVISGTLDAAGPTLQSATASPRHAEHLGGTPFEEMADPPEVDSLTLGERFNVVFVLAVSEIVQIMMVAVVTATLFLALGLILLNPQLLAAWAPRGSGDGTFVGFTVPVPQALIEMTLFLGALTFMYISARTVADGEYRSRFLESIIQDLKLTLLARNRYRHDTLLYDSAGQATVARAGVTLDAPDGSSALIQLLSWIPTPSPSGPGASRAAAIAQSDSR